MFGIHFDFDQMAFSDQIAFLYVHGKNGEIVFTTEGASRHCPVIPGSRFADLVAENTDCQVFKDQTLCQSPLMNKYELALRNAQDSLSWNAYVCEAFMDGGFHGVIFYNNINTEALDYLASILLKKGALARRPLLMPCNETGHGQAGAAANIVEAFEKNLLHFAKHDEWFTSGGKERFLEQVKFYVLRDVPVQLMLPAFPVKSCNTSKVLGKLPDKGEELAIHSMKIVADDIKAIYPPGVCFNIVSDGHVFSDLMGVDDATVDSYGEMLRSMANSSYPGLVNFYGLDDFLFLEGEGNESCDLDKMIEGTTLDRPVITELTNRAEIARRVLLFLFGKDASLLRQEINNNSETMALYSGFKTFATEDLAERKIYPSNDVGFLMIQRNRAYSAMVQWLFPIHIRISIHPHPNRGPKYGINLVHPSLVVLQRTSSETLFHTPTPWHNAVLEMADGKFVLLPSALIKPGLVVNGEIMNKVTLLHYPDGRPSHFKQLES